MRHVPGQQTRAALRHLTRPMNPWRSSNYILFSAICTYIGVSAHPWYFRFAWQIRQIIFQSALLSSCLLLAIPTPQSHACHRRQKNNNPTLWGLKSPLSFKASFSERADFQNWYLVPAKPFKWTLLSVRLHYWTDWKN